MFSDVPRFLRKGEEGKWRRGGSSPAWGEADRLGFFAIVAVNGCGIAASTVLQAALYGWRFYAPLAWLDIPWMRALHGTANALGFGLGGSLAWRMANGDLRNNWCLSQVDSSSAALPPSGAGKRRSET
jgi:hypothetical protein